MEEDVCSNNLRGDLQAGGRRHPNPAKPEPKFHRMEDMSALRAKTEAGWVLAGALVLSGFLFFRYLIKEMSSRPEGEILCIWSFSSQKIFRYARNDRSKLRCHPWRNDGSGLNKYTDGTISVTPT
uniref:Uncharacterized protein n=1 Tax=Candidatus Kentrum sp. LFY TaxID=2126342 RepID=A0A450U7L6_9GAMM|nr:MAG: hypothetical protein BECKLFY1418B_GA0070995_100810 [Candidatus Kentron sp. LFY]